MFCHECGKEIADDSKFCPECGAHISAPAPEIPMQSTPVQGMPVQSIPKVKEKKSLFRTIISPVVYYPAMVILVALAIILGRSQNKAAEVTDLAQFVGATEQEVVEAFGCEVNEMGWYPGEEELALTCVDGKVAMISVSKDSEYSFAGCKAGDKFEEKREELEKEYRFYNSTEADGDVVYVYFFSRNNVSINSS